MSLSRRHAATFVLVMMLAAASLLAGLVRAEETDPMCALPPSSEEYPSPVIHRLTVSPAGEPVPALRYRFLVPPAEQIRANAAIFYYKAMHSGGEGWLKNLYANDGLESWLEGAPKDLPLETIKPLVKPATAPIFQSAMRAASRADHCDWGDRELGEEIPHLEAGGRRQIAIALSLLAKVQLAEDRTEDALETVGWGYAMAHHLGSAINPLGFFEGRSIAGFTQSAACALVGQIDAPNLYWALTEVAARSARPTDGVQGRRSLEATFPKLAELDRRVFTDDELVELAKQLSVRSLIRVEARTWDARDEAALLSTTLSLLPEARAFLQRHGYAAERVDKMPLVQQVILYRWQQFIELEQNSAKWTLLPERDGRSRSLRKAAQNLDARSDEGQPFAIYLFPPAGELRAMLRTQGAIDLLRAVEALRMYAAAEGQWPRTLDDVTAVPVPLDSVTDAPFGYSVKGYVATLCAPMVIWRGDRAPAVHYELTLRKPAGAAQSPPDGKSP